MENYLASPDLITTRKVKGQNLNKKIIYHTGGAVIPPTVDRSADCKKLFKKTEHNFNITKCGKGHFYAYDECYYCLACTENKYSKQAKIRKALNNLFGCIFSRSIVPMFKSIDDSFVDYANIKGQTESIRLPGELYSTYVSEDRGIIIDFFGRTDYNYKAREKLCDESGILYITLDIITSKYKKAATKRVIFFMNDDRANTIKIIDQLFSNENEQSEIMKMKDGNVMYLPEEFVQLLEINPFILLEI